MPEPATYPLLQASGLPAPVPIVVPATQPLSGIQRFAVTTFAILRIIRGFGFVIYPALSVSSFELPPNGNTFVLGSLLGVRDLLLGGLLYTADEYLEREVRRALVVNLLSDAFDTFILIFSAACSAKWEHHVAGIAFVAVLAFLEHLTLFSMNDDDELIARHAANGVYGYQTMVHGDDDKKKRMNSWLAELQYAEEVRSVTPTEEQQQMEE